MRASVAEVTLRRLLAWLQWVGQEPTPERQAAILRCIADNMTSDTPELCDRCLQPLLAEIDIPSPAPASPPLQRGSIDYGDY